ncbi:hypothetical protein KY290_018451 [Solanum tuberosum]|uniref:Uncharacterized protein n=1 Tax=Solanum tuberosum TaxID=4113 RepID=A0ABQ7VE78_SOLTU|nr:hypothetical protein KY290_018451 [Solanum tuberosum]
MNCSYFVKMLMFFDPRHEGCQFEDGSREYLRGQFLLSFIAPGYPFAIGSIGLVELFGYSSMSSGNFALLDRIWSSLFWGQSWRRFVIILFFLTIIDMIGEDMKFGMARSHLSFFLGSVRCGLSCYGYGCMGGHLGFRMQLLTEPFSESIGSIFIGTSPRLMAFEVTPIG